MVVYLVKMPSLINKLKYHQACSKPPELQFLRQYLAEVHPHPSIHNGKLFKNQPNQ